MMTQKLLSSVLNPRDPKVKFLLQLVLWAGSAGLRTRTRIQILVKVALYSFDIIPEKKKHGNTFRIIPTRPTCVQRMNKSDHKRSLGSYSRHEANPVCFHWLNTWEAKWLSSGHEIIKSPMKIYWFLRETGFQSDNYHVFGYKKAMWMFCDSCCKDLVNIFFGRVNDSHSRY